ncbi:hypothetical protein FLK61_25315 [Paenalkalicoccus suaedae]|uniref:Uncharacterized protein n=1 Tax=Paenalkalicoccus suaedae TaxID=2592382 RepID=A0A859FC12_9BACI|nr:hypothetical protein [Paenalkalicoccus suaedae]QKS70094.1 hypothetical protein FLK61_25315 [Paenalkalicoccus suaedae]
MVFNMIYQLLALSVLIIPVAILIYVLIVVRKVNNRSEERLRLEKENDAHRQQQAQELNDMKKRLTHIEDMLKEVD